MKTGTYGCLFALVGVLGFVLTGSSATRYVAVTNTTPASPYTNWATAALVIQDAVDAAATGDEILVADGVYATGGRAVYGTMTNRVAIDKAVIVRSVNGPNLTMIVGQGAGGVGTSDGDGAFRCVYVGSNAVLSGFTLTNGHTRGWYDGDLYQERSGGGACCEASGVVTNCTLTGNSAISGGGAYSGTLNNCTLTGNSAEGAGGGACDSTLNNCRVVGNSAYNLGGGAYSGTLNNCTLQGNSARSIDGMGGGSCSGRLNNCILTGNSAGSLGGGTHFGILNNCTLTGNLAGKSGGGASGGRLNNCIVYYNTAPGGPNYNTAPGGLGYCYFAYSCTTPLARGVGNIDTDPLLASSTHLSAQSPCIGRGNPAYTSGVDIDGQPWLTPPCMGADQFVAGAAGILFVSITAAYTNVSSGFGVSFAAQSSGRLTGSVWDFGDGVVVSNRPYANHVWVTPGLYEVRLTGYNNDFPGGVGATALVQVGAQQVYYVNGANLTPAFPYTSWAGAATTIQEAIDAGTQIGRLVRVTNGVYASGGRALFLRMTNRVVVAEGVEVRSENGPLVTFIAGQAAPGTTNNGYGAIRCAYVGSNAVLSGFTLTNGHTQTETGWSDDKDTSGGGALCAGTGLLTNCTLTGNSAHSGGGVSDGTLYTCTLIGNSSTDEGGGAHFSTLNHCTLAGNSAACGGGASCSMLSNCTLDRNLAFSDGGGTYDGTLINCSLTGNSAAYGGGDCRGTLNNCTLVRNTVAGQGGGTAYSILNNCTLATNSAGYDGGGAVGSWLNHCTVTGNSAVQTGGGASGSTFNNCILTGNSATYGGGVYDGSLTNCTLTGNSAARYGGGASSGTLYNCIVYNNTATDHANYLGGIFYDSCTTPLAFGWRNITNTPLFMNTNGWANLRLQSNSPCINAGRNNYASASTDLDGNPRIAGSKVDMGAYESQGAIFSGFSSWLWQYGLRTDGSADYLDSDGDGLSNWQEWLSKTHPTNSQSVLKLFPPVCLDTNVQLQWPSVAGVLYQIECSTNLSTPPNFQPVSPPIPGGTNLTSFYDTNSSLPFARFYRLRVLEQ